MGAGIEQTLWKSGGRNTKQREQGNECDWAGENKGGTYRRWTFFTEKKERQMVRESLDLEKKTMVSKALAESSNFGENTEL